MLGRNTFADKVLLLKLGLLNLVLFLAVYIPTNTSVRESYFEFYFPWELHAPLIDWMILPYHGFIFLLLFPFFLLTRRHIQILGVSFALCTVIAGIFFVLFPAQLGFDRVVPESIFLPLYTYLFAFDSPTNLVPSLHVTYATLYFVSCVRFLKTILMRVLFALLTTTIILSTLFTHQHHVVDIITGVLLGAGVYLFVICRLSPENSLLRFQK